MSKDFTGQAQDYLCWYERDFEYSAAGMHWLAKLLYRTLLQKAGQLSTRPDLPNDPAQLMNILGIPAPTWELHAAAVMSRFQIDPATGLLFHPRLRRDYEKFCLYISKQTKNGRKGGRPRQAIPPTGDKATANPTPTQINQMKLKESKRKEVPEITQDDDAVPSAPLGSVTPPEESKATPEPPSAPTDKKTKCDELVAFVFAETGFQPPSNKSVRDLVDQYPLPAIKDGFKDVIWNKSKGDLCATVKLFFQGGAAGIILAHQQKEFLDNLKYFIRRPDDDERSFEEVIADRPAGIADSVIQDARRRHKQFLDSQAVKS